MYCSLWGGSGEDGGLRHLVLADSPYLVAMALIDQQGRRALPLGGRSQKEVAPQGEAPEALGHALVLELLLRVWQRSDQGALQRAAGADRPAAGGAADGTAAGGRAQAQGGTG